MGMKSTLLQEYTQQRTIGADVGGGGELDVTEVVLSILPLQEFPKC